MTTRKFEPLLTIRDVQQLLHISRNTVYLLTKAGDLRPIKIGSAVRFTGAEVERFVRECRQ